MINAVMLSMLALWHGVKATTVASGSPTDLIVMRESAETELSSWVTREAYEVLRTLPGIAKDANGQPLVSPELDGEIEGLRQAIIAGELVVDSPSRP